MVNTYHASAESGTILNLEISGRPPFNFRWICDQSLAQFGSKGVYQYDDCQFATKFLYRSIGAYASLERMVIFPE